MLFSNFLSQFDVEQWICHGSVPPPFLTKRMTHPAGTSDTDLGVCFLAPLSLSLSLSVLYLSLCPRPLLNRSASR